MLKTVGKGGHAGELTGGLPGGGRPELHLGRTGRMDRAARTRTRHTPLETADLSSWQGVERSDWPEPNLVFMEIVVRQMMDHRVGPEPIAVQSQVDIFELEVSFRTCFTMSSASGWAGRGSGRSRRG